MLSIPWFIYVALIGVFVSAYMVIRTTKQDREVEESFIEKEGSVFIERMNSEKERRIEKVKKPEPM